MGYSQAFSQLLETLGLLSTIIMFMFSIYYWT